MPGETKPRPTERPGLRCCSGRWQSSNGGPADVAHADLVRLRGYGNGIVLNTPHGVTAPAPLMLCVPVTPGM
jgi:hypothetical protein